MTTNLDVSRRINLRIGAKSPWKPMKWQQIPMKSDRHKSINPHEGDIPSNAVAGVFTGHSQTFNSSAVGVVTNHGTQSVRVNYYLFLFN
jgi:hypothetical protein